MLFGRLRLVAFSLFCFWTLPTDSEAGFTQVNLDQRFFSDERFGNVNGFSPYFAPQFELQIGWWSFLGALDLVASFSYLKNTSVACAVETQGSDQCLELSGAKLSSQDQFRYQMISVGQGFRYSLPQSWMFRPYLQMLATYRYARVKKETFNIEEATKVSGYDFGADLSAGFLVSFLPKASQVQLSELWGVDQLALSLHGRYLPSGFFKKGLGQVSNTGGYSFGFGIHGEW